jgi:hypothetical protein
MKRALQAILAVGVFGLVFSGVLSYRELFGSAAVACPAPGAPGTVFGYPACVSGCCMDLLLVALAGAGLRAGAGPARRATQRSPEPPPSAAKRSRLPCCAPALRAASRFVLVFRAVCRGTAKDLAALGALVALPMRTLW